MSCHGNGPEHCCWTDGVVCRWLVESTGARRWVCSLRHQLGSWAAVHADARYAPIRALLESRGVPELCGGFGARQGQCCYAGEVQR